MKIAAAIVVFLFAVWMLAPIARLSKVMWMDRHLPATHPDYAGVWIGKKIVPLAITFLVLIDSALVWGGIRLCT